MNAFSQTDNLGPELQPTEGMLRATYPAGVPEADYIPMLALLSEGMSHRQAARVVAQFTGKPYAVVYNDVLRAVSGQGLDDVAIEVVRRLLQRQGYDEWIAKAE